MELKKHTHSSYRDFIQIISFHANQIVSPFWHFCLLSLSKIMCSEENYELL